MIMNGLAQRWAELFGLASAPLFETTDVPAEGSHAVLLDGGYGSFAMSETAEELWRDKETACWAWSSNLPHHVTVTENVVAVTRWDNSRAEVLSRSSVEAQIESFYSYLATDRVQSNKRVVDYVLNLFRRMRSLVADADLPDERSIARRIHGCRSLTVDFTRAWAGVRRFSAPGVEVVSVGVRG